VKNEDVQTEMEKSAEAQGIAAADAGAGEPVPGLVMGRHVFYEDADGTHAAIVAHVNNAVSGEVNLTVLHHDGRMYEQTCVPQDALSGDGYQVGSWRWMFNSQPTALTGDKGKHNL